MNAGERILDATNTTPPPPDGLPDWWHTWRIPPEPPTGLPLDAVVITARLDTSHTGHPMIVASLATTDCTFGTADGTLLPPLYLSLNPKARPLLEQGLRALGFALPPGEKVAVSAAALVGRRLRVRLERDRYGILRSTVG